MESRRHGPRERRDRLLACLAGVIFAADLIFWNYSIQSVGAGLATVLGNVQVVLVALIAWLVLGERPTSRTLLAIPVALSGVVLISGVVGSGAYGDDPALGVLYGLLTAISYARVPADPAPGREQRPAAGGAAVRRDPVERRRRRDRREWRSANLDLTPGLESQAWLVLLALSSQVLGWMLISVSLPRLPAALTSILLMLQPVCTVMLGALLLDESPSPVQLAGVAIVLAARRVCDARLPLS